VKSFFFSFFLKFSTSTEESCYSHIHSARMRVQKKEKEKTNKFLRFDELFVVLSV
jgi:hypothetical protein